MTNQSSKTTHTCWICGKPTSLESCKVDENGLPVHESCQALRLSLHNQTRPKPGSTARWPQRSKAC